MKYVIKILSLLLSFLLLIVASGLLYREYLWRWISHPSFGWFILPFVSSCVLFGLFLPPISFYSTLRHELCHWFFALVSFNKPAALNVHADGGGSYSYYGRSNYFIVLSPYFFPLISLALLLVSLFFNRPSYLYFLLIGVVFAFETISMVKDYHPHQTDLQKYGQVFSYLFAIVMYLQFAFGLFVILFSGWKGYWKYLSRIFNTLSNIIFSTQSKYTIYEFQKHIGGYCQQNFSRQRRRRGCCFE